MRTSRVHRPARQLKQGTQQNWPRCRVALFHDVVEITQNEADPEVLLVPVRGVLVRKVDSVSGRMAFATSVRRIYIWYNNRWVLPTPDQAHSDQLRVALEPVMRRMTNHAVRTQTAYGKHAHITS